MEIALSDKVQIWKKYNTLVNLNLHERKNYFLNNPDLMDFKLGHFNPTKIKVDGVIFQVVPATALLKTNSKTDNCYRYMYMQINLKTKEYYLGSIKRRKWGEAKHYTTPELKLEGKHPDYPGEFIRLYFAPCDTDKELATVQKSLLEAVLSADPQCLNSRKNIDHIIANEKYWKISQVKGQLSELDILGAFFDYEVAPQKTAPAPASQQVPKAAPAKKQPSTTKAAAKTSAKAINMVDLATGQVLQQFASQKDAATWLVQEGKAKSMSCASSISAVCRGTGNRKQAYGYKWTYVVQ